MSKKTDQSTVYISVISVIIGAVFGYFGTRASSYAQIQVAQENANAQMTNVAVSVYGPIFTTQTAEAKLTSIAPALVLSATPLITSPVLKIEEISQDIGVFVENLDDKLAFSGTASLVVAFDDGALPIYRFNYELPVSQVGQAGMSFTFANSQNLSLYSNLKFRLIYSNINDDIIFYIKDISGAENEVEIALNSDKEMILEFPLSHFNAIDLNAVAEIGLIATTECCSGYHEVGITEIQFTQ